MVDYTSYTDNTLMELLRSNDEDAFNVLYQRYWKKLFIRANTILQSAEDAEEVIHDVFVSLWKKRESIQVLVSFQAYISASLHYACFKVLTKRKQSRNIEITYNGLPEKEVHTTQEYLDQSFAIQDLEKAMLSLPEKCKLVFQLSRGEGLSNKEIASALNISINTVRTQMHRALLKLKTIMSSFFLFFF